MPQEEPNAPIRKTRFNKGTVSYHWKLNVDVREEAAIERLKPIEFRRRVVAGSFPQFNCLSEAVAGLQFIQADPIRSPARAQDLMLRQRIEGYQAGDLERQSPDIDVEEGYLFAYGFMTPQVWDDVRQRPLKKKLSKLERDVLAAVADMEEAHPRGLDDRFAKKSVTNVWGGKSQQTKQVLDKLHHHGYLRVCRRENGIRVYQFVGKPDEESTDPSELYRRLALTTANVFGPTTKRFLLSELRSHNHVLPSRADRSAAIDALVDTGQLTEIEVDGVTYLWQSSSWQSDDIQDRVRILAPFDPLVRDRDRFEKLWGWTYRFEAYVPAAKRVRGYYAMPVLWRDQVIGWANATVVDDRLKIEVGFVNKRPRAKAFRLAAEKEIIAMADFLNLEVGSIAF
ncbi:hypothetical protein LF1_04640 [Rubripirellula obstinata]|uniref:Winged helix DNA-binding domain-containing protein n=1 Tax=Rubripirellula obstinata TaxID=406547 RepID=A0A5B1CET3_9BACT|nr:crosslink repair DNA glycosylase YcaQ family protein [Rubripirellula obstinata]KAA1257973.1 hypothetical protein LF1_04640 [Rubripirellula obstinata]